jgi:hypothetical protein
VRLVHGGYQHQGAVRVSVRRSQLSEGGKGVSLPERARNASGKAFCKRGVERGNVSREVEKRLVPLVAEAEV